MGERSVSQREFDVLSNTRMILGLEHRIPEIGTAFGRGRLQHFTASEDLCIGRGSSIAVDADMNRRPFWKAVLAAGILSSSPSFRVRAQALDQLVPRNVALNQVTYQGRSAIQAIATPASDNGSSYALLKDINFQDGAIEVDVAGKPATGAGPEARGFIGIAFRLRDNNYEYIYLRPTNGRGRPGAPESLHAVRIISAIRFRPFAAGIARKVRVLCGPGTGRLDKVQDRNRGS